MGALTGMLKLFRKNYKTNIFKTIYSEFVNTPTLDLKTVFFDDGPPYIPTDHALTPISLSLPSSPFPSSFFFCLSINTRHSSPFLLLSDFLQRLPVFEHHIVLTSWPSAQKREAQVSLHGFEISSLNILFYFCFPDGSTETAGHGLVLQHRRKRL